MDVIYSEVVKSWAVKRLTVEVTEGEKDILITDIQFVLNTVELPPLVRDLLDTFNNGLRQ